MSDEQLRIAAAEACPNMFWVYRSPIESAISLRPARGRVFRNGDHPAEGDKECDLMEDLNACASFEAGLNSGQRLRYGEALHGILKCGFDLDDDTQLSGWSVTDVATATARQRCLAYLATVAPEKLKP